MLQQGSRRIESMSCLECNETFRPKRPWQRFCSKKCRWDQWSRNHPRTLKRDDTETKETSDGLALNATPAAS